VNRIFPLEFVFAGKDPLGEEFGGKFLVILLEFFLGGYEHIREELGGKCFIHLLDCTLGQKNSHSY